MGQFSHLYMTAGKTINFPGGSDSKASAYIAGNLGSIPGSGRPPGEGNGNPLQYSCLGNPMDRGAWQATVHEVVVKSQIRLSDSLPTTSDQCATSIWKWRDSVNTNDRAFLLPLLTWSHCWGAELGGGKPRPSSPPSSQLTYNLRAAGWGITSQAKDGGCNYLPALWSFSQEYLLSLSRVIRTATSSWRRQNSLSTTLPPSLPESRKQGEGR